MNPTGQCNCPPPRKDCPVHGETPWDCGDRGLSNIPGDFRWCPVCSPELAWSEARNT